MSALEKDLLKKIKEVIKKTKPMQFNLFITKNSSGFKFQDGDWKFQCIMYKNHHGKKIHRCQSNNEFINAVMNGADWAASKIEGLFDDLKDGLEDVGDGVVDAAKATGNAVEGAAKATANAAVDAAKATAKAASDVVSDLNPLNWKK